MLRELTILLETKEVEPIGYFLMHPSLSVGLGDFSGTGTYLLSGIGLHMNAKVAQSMR